MFFEVLRGCGIVLFRLKEELEVREGSGRGPGGVQESSGRGPGEVFRGFWWLLGGYGWFLEVLSGFGMVLRVFQRD